jgi:hypothetical protein
LFRVMADMLDMTAGSASHLPHPAKGDATMRTVKPQASTSKNRSAGQRPELRYGVPGTPEERRRGLRALLKHHAETLRRLAR